MRVPVGVIAAAVAVPLVYGTLRKFFPAAEHASGDASLDELRVVHHRTEVVGTLLFFFVLTPLCTYAWWLLFLDLAAYNVGKFSDPVAVITPGGLYWLLVAVLPGALTAAFPADLFVRLLRRRRRRQWLRYLELRYGFRQDGKGVAILFLFLAIPALILVLLTLNWYFVLAQNGIHVNPWLTSERVYRYDEVAEILMDESTYADTDYVRRVYVFKFTDGFSWPTTPGLIGGRQDRWTEVAQILSRRSGLSITKADLPES